MREKYIFPLASASEQALMRWIDTPPPRESEHDLYVHRFEKLVAACVDLNAFDRETGHAPIHRLVDSITDPRLLTPLIDCLLAAGAQIDAYDIPGDAPLHVAICAANHHACRILIDRGANPNLVVFGTHCHPLELTIDAIRYPEVGELQPRMIEVFRVLVRLGARVPPESRCLVLAAGGNDHGVQSDLPEVIDLLVHAGAAVDFPEEATLRRAIHYAAMRGHWQSAARLFAAGADALNPDVAGFLPFNYAEQFSAQSDELRAVIRAAEMQAIIQLGTTQSGYSLQSKHPALKFSGT